MDSEELKKALKNISKLKADICKKCKGTGKIHKGQYVGGLGGVKELLYPCPDCCIGSKVESMLETVIILETNEGLKLSFKPEDIVYVYINAGSAIPVQAKIFDKDHPVFRIEYNNSCYAIVKVSK